MMNFCAVTGEALIDGRGKWRGMSAGGGWRALQDMTAVLQEKKLFHAWVLINRLYLVVLFPGLQKRCDYQVDWTCSVLLDRGVSKCREEGLHRSCWESELFRVYMEAEGGRFARGALWGGVVAESVEGIMVKQIGFDKCGEVEVM